MTFWAILPVKPLRLGKSRLAGVLDEQERFLLNQGLIENTLKVLLAVPEIERLLVISRDPQVLAFARGRGAHTLQESGVSSLNMALEKATRLARDFAVQGVLVIPADLPLLNMEDIQTMMGLAEHPPVVVIAPDRHRRGTNALLVNPLGALRYAFGRGSFHTHCQVALCSEIRLEVAELPRLAVDLDTPDDLEFLRKEMGSLAGDWENLFEPPRHGEHQETPRKYEENYKP